MRRQGKRQRGCGARLPRSSRNAEKLMRLEAESPARVVQAVAERRRGIGLASRPVHRLEKEMAEVERLEPRGVGARLGIDQLELVAPAHLQWGTCLGTHTEPVDTGRWLDRAVGLHRDL